MISLLLLLGGCGANVNDTPEAEKNVVTDSGESYDAGYNAGLEQGFEEGFEKGQDPEYNRDC